jgi:uncharacterized membrane protein
MSDQEVDDAFVEDVKRWFHSKTIWFNLLALIPAAFGLIEQYLPSLQAVLPPWAFALLSIVVALVNIQLRRISRKPIQ